MPASGFHTSSRSAPARFPIWLGWIAAAVAIAVAFLMGSRLMTLGTEVNMAHTETELARAEAQDYRQQLEAEQIIATRQIADLQASRVLGEAVLVKLTPALPTAPAESVVPFGLLVWQAKSHEGILWTESLPAAKAGEGYRLWLAAATGDWVLAGNVDVAAEGPVKTVFLTETPLSLARILITREPINNAPAQPTGDPILTGKL